MFGIAGSTEDAVPWVPIGVAHLALTAANFALAGAATARADEQAGTTSAPLESAPAAIVPLFSYGGTF